MIKAKHPLLIVGLSLLAALTLATGAASITAYAYQNRIQPRTVIAGESIGSLSHAQADQAISRKQAELANAQITLSYNGQSATLLLQEVGVSIAGVENNVIISSRGMWDWASFNYWQEFFRRKEVGLLYQLDRDVAQKKIEEAFGVTSTARSAEIIISDGALAVADSQAGESIGLDILATAIQQILKTGQGQEVTLAAAVVEPSISTQAATQTKTEIEGTLQPIYLAGDGRSFTIPKADLYTMIDYSPNNGVLGWSLNNERLQGYLASRIAGRINLKMLQKIIQSDTLEVVQEGRDGKSVDLTQLVANVKRTITEQISTKGAPIEIGVASIPFTERVVHPDYVAGLFEGLYIDINLTKQKLFIMNGHTKTAEYIISSGKRGTPTPVGLFYIKNKIELAESRLYPGIWMQKWNALAKNPDGSGYEGYGLHRVPCFNSSCTITENYSHLGLPASHGCVRIADEGADWVYANAPVGTPVNIHT